MTYHNAGENHKILVEWATLTGRDFVADISELPIFPEKHHGKLSSTLHTDLRDAFDVARTDMEALSSNDRLAVMRVNTLPDLLRLHADFDEIASQRRIPGDRFKVAQRICAQGTEKVTVSPWASFYRPAQEIGGAKYIFNELYKMRNAFNTMATNAEKYRNMVPWSGAVVSTGMQVLRLPTDKKYKPEHIFFHAGATGRLNGKEVPLWHGAIVPDPDLRVEIRQAGMIDCCSVPYIQNWNIESVQESVKQEGGAVFPFIIWHNISSQHQVTNIRPIVQQEQLQLI